MAKLSKASDAAKATDGADTLINVIQESTVQKSWSEAFRYTLTAVRETRDAWRRYS